MLWFKIAWRNLWRNRRRTGIQLAAISGSMFLAVFFNNLSEGMYVTMIDGGVRSGSGHIGLYHRDYLDSRRVSDTIPADRLVVEVASDPAVDKVFGRLQVPGLLRSSRDSRAAVALGIDFEAEAGTNPMLAKESIVSGGLPAGPGGILIGEALARELQVDVGKKVVWMAQDAGGEIASRLFKVSGLIRTNVRAIDAGTVLASRTALGEVLGRKGDAHEIAILLARPDSAGEALPRLRAIAGAAGSARAYPWQEAMPSLAALIEIGNNKQRGMVFVLFALVAIGTLNTMLMSVMERTREFGMLRAIGIGKGAIRQMVVAEAFVLGLVGTAIGVVAAWLLDRYTGTKGIDFSQAMSGDIGGIAIDPIVRTAWSWPLVSMLAAGMIALSILASLYPARWALKTRPADAMRIY